MRLAMLTGALVLILDQLTKYLVLRWLPPGAVVVVVEGILNLTLVQNPGLAFGLLGNVPPEWRWIVAALSVGALVVLGRVAVRLLSAGTRLGLVALGLVFGGAVGNLIDRARSGAVVDFVDLHWRDYHWPAFNVADSSISIGVVLLAFQLVAHDRRRG
jgi:signal peptidase II